MKIQKYLRMCGIASRRKAEELVKNACVKVNGQTVHDYVQVQLDDVVEVKGKLIKPHKRVYYMFNKPAGCITTKDDPQGRKTIFDLIDVRIDVFPVGRLDKDTKGLLLLTNDGETSQILLHPRYEVNRVYEAMIEGCIEQKVLEKMRKGMKLPYGYVSKMNVITLSSDNGTSKVEITIREGRKREIRRAFKFVKHTIIELKRIAFGPIVLDQNLKLGEYRQLTEEEERVLRKFVDDKRMRPLRRVSP